MRHNTLRWRARAGRSFGMAALVGITLAGGGALAVANATVAHATPTTPPTLTGEILQTSQGTGTTSGADFTCTSTEGGATLSFQVSGTASGPYPGTFTESGTFTKNTFQASFTITSGTTTVTGTKTSGADIGFSCNDVFDAISGHMPYTANIATSTGNFADGGGVAQTAGYVGQTSFFSTDNTPNGVPNLCVSAGTTNLVPCPVGTTAVVTEQFQSSNNQTKPIITCTKTITGTHTGALIVSAGTTLCLVNATQNGAIVVQQGGSLVATNSRISGAVSADHPVNIRLCGNNIGGSVSVNGATGPVLVGDPANGCAGNTIGGSLVLQNNTGGVVANGNTVAGATVISGNSGPSPTP